MNDEPAPHDKGIQQTLRAGIRQTYTRYQKQDRDRFPTVDYNTNRANYEPLRASFEHELFVVKGIDPKSPAIRIPSTNTLARLFTDDQYVPGAKILTACRWYADLPVDAGQDAGRPAPHQNAFFRRWRAWLLVFSLVVCVLLYQLIQSDEGPGKLVIHHPKPGQVVPRLLHVSGRLERAKGESVWLVVRPAKLTTEYYVQGPALVQPDGSWDMYVFIGTNDDQFVGYPFDIRAFVGLDDAYTVMPASTGYIQKSWPEHAASSTKAIRVVRGKSRY